MNYQNYGRQGFQRQPTITPPVVPASLDDAPKREPDVPKVLTHHRLVKAKKNGKLWIVHETVIQDWKPVTYYETIIGRGYAENAKR